MKFSDNELKLILNWFDIAQDSLGDDDLKLFDRMSSYLKEDTSEEEREDELYFDVASYSSSEYSNGYEEDEGFDC